jgi:hypothetical protein
MTAAFLFGLTAFAAVLANIAVRDHRRTLAARRALLDDCRGVLDAEQWTAGDDGFPALRGRADGRPVEVALIPDTMVMRRLPQLWLSVTVKGAAPGTPALSLLARHTGNEYYAMTPELPLRLEPPAGLPTDILVRGDRLEAQHLCDRLAPELAALFADPKLKEVTLTANGVRTIRQIAEGQRGEHLLLRQAVFGEARVEQTDLRKALADIAALLEGRDIARKVHAA